jgi:hypothetical protein
MDGPARRAFAAADERDHMHTSMMACAASLAVAGVVHAEFLGFEVSSSTFGNLVKSEVYAKFSGATDTLLNAFHLNRVGGGGAPVFYHSDALSGGAYSSTVGSWNPTFVLSAGAFDSYVCIGGGEGPISGNTTNADPDWGQAGFNQAQVPFLGAPGNTTNGPGWFNSNPPNLQGRVDSNGRVKVGQFVTAAGSGPYTMFLKVGYVAYEGGSPLFGDGTFTVPAPGALALLSATGLLRRRRR